MGIGGGKLGCEQGCEQGGRKPLCEAAKLGAKRLLLQRFPFSIVTIANSHVITVVAFAHHSRKPGYWHERIAP
jgi:hypothetical protein